MKILVTGGAGFIGQNVVNELLIAGHSVRVIDSLRPDVHHGNEVKFSDDVNFIHEDIRNEILLPKVLNGIDHVIHLAGKVGLGVDMYDTVDYTSSNVLATAILLEEMTKQNISNITLASSMVVYGEGYSLCAEHGKVIPTQRNEDDLTKGIFEANCPMCDNELTPISVIEDDPLMPRNVYASTKLAQENLCSSWSRLTNGSVSAMRYHNVYGPKMPKDSMYSGVAAIFISSLLRDQAPKVFEDGCQRRDFIHVSDIAKATVKANLNHKSGFRAFNTGSGTIRTIGNMANELSKAFNGKAPIVTKQYRLGDVRHITADSTRLKTELDWQPEIDFEKGMKGLVDEAMKTNHV